jgi:hypothetical protein
MPDRIHPPWRARAKLAVALAIAYVIAVSGFWIAGAAAFTSAFHGPARLLGLLYVPILVLPVAGRGELAGVAVRSPIWLWWFGLQTILAAATIWVYPFDRSRRRVIGPRIGRARHRSGASAPL